MSLVPFSYNLRSVLVRRSTTLLTILGIAATVAVLAGVLALEQGFTRLFTDNGRDDVVIFLRPGATAETESGFRRESVDILIKSLPEIATDESGRPLASAETYLAVRRLKVDGGETNVPIRGVQPMSLAIAGDRMRFVDGRPLKPGTDEVIVGSKLVGRIQNCAVGEVIVLNTTPFRVVGVFDYEGPFSSEIWADVERMSEALDRPGFNRVIAVPKPETDLDAFRERMASDVRTPCQVFTEAEYLGSVTERLSGILIGLGAFLAFIMGLAAVFTAANTMIAAVASRTHEIGVLRSIGFKPLPIFVSFLLEALLLGLIGGVVGCLLTLPLHGVETGTTNSQTFTEIAFAFRVTPKVLVTAVTFAVVLGLLGGAWPAWRAARMTPTEAMRRA